mgnify:CR=1 FL=1
MAKREIVVGSTSQTIDVFILDSTSATGAGLSGLVFNSSGLKAYYRKGATGSATAITLATQTVGGAYSSGGFVEIDATNMKGVYRLDLPNAAVDTAGMVTVYLYGGTNMAPVVAEIETVNFDKFDSSRMGLKTMGVGTVTSGATTTSVPTSSCSPAGGVADQFKDRVIVFTSDTTTAGLRGVAKTISASTNAAAPTFTVGTLPATPASGDTFVIV